ncbi:hypothetical protein DM01DRAFT_1331430 [Hesseltinella vesiculosa]|uniref:Uncharacterized protein n=1 Tax=Hesseltinella vesiculosa TaxID=101127 RepID=A0A1X2GVC4_9FUNG|nr:hypothetical protein DM01DRAFT_1331430 [Hesseltinella vesiculosa]
MDDKVNIVLDSKVNGLSLLRDHVWPWCVVGGRFVGYYVLYLPLAALLKIIWLGLGFLVWPLYCLFTFFVVQPVNFLMHLCHVLYPVAIYLVGAVSCGLIIGACAGFTYEALATMLYNLTWGGPSRKEQGTVQKYSIEEDAHILALGNGHKSGAYAPLHHHESDDSDDDKVLDSDDSDRPIQTELIMSDKKRGKQPARASSPHLRRRTGVMMTTVDSDKEEWTWEDDRH